jgi:hypothetical protein
MITRLPLNFILQDFLQILSDMHILLEILLPNTLGKQKRTRVQ